MTDDPLAGDGPDPDLSDLMRAAQEGDQGAVEALLVRHLPELHAYARLRMGSLLRARESSVDLVQSACREVLENLPRFQHHGSRAFRRWLFKTVHRKICDRYEYYRAQKRDAGRERALLQGGSHSVDDQLLATYRSFCSPSGEAMAAELVDQIEAAFRALPERYQQVIFQARIIGMPHAEIARETGLTEEGARSLLFRAMAALARELEQ